MATFCLVHGAWHGGWAWDRLRPELEARGHEVVAPDLPCEDCDAGIEEYAAVVRAAIGGVDDAVVVGHSLGGLTIPLVPARLRVFLCALVAGTGWEGVFVPGFGDARVRDELGRSYYPDPADAARELQYPLGSAALAARLRRQAPVDDAERASPHPAVYVVCTRDAVIRPEWQRHLAREVLGVGAIELAAGHSPMLSHPRELAELLGGLA
ncbi:MAG TPA: alpha/beta fold hydrolase [Gaiellaceae bacterium]|nr:alpha/beta fold hydrolase [Gaiellaceae bacterium]